MFEIIGLAAGGAALVAGHIKSKQFVARRLRFTSFVENPALGLFAGVGAAILAAPLVALVPFVGAGTALAFGIGVGTGVAVGANRARSGDSGDSF